MLQWWGCGVLMVVVCGFGFVHGGEREREKERETKTRGKREIIIANIYILLCGYIILMY